MTDIPAASFPSLHLHVYALLQSLQQTSYRISAFNISIPLVFCLESDDITTRSHSEVCALTSAFQAMQQGPRLNDMAPSHAPLHP